jgi:hypothetical protein
MKSILCRCLIGCFGGARGNRTLDKGFADLCLTTWLPRPKPERSITYEQRQLHPTAPRASSSPQNKKPTIKSWEGEKLRAVIQSLAARLSQPTPAATETATLCLSRELGEVSRSHHSLSPYLTRTPQVNTSSLRVSALFSSGGHGFSRAVNSAPQNGL